MHEQDQLKLISIIEEIISCRISPASLMACDLHIMDPDSVDDITIVKSFIQNKQMLTNEYIKSLIADQLKPVQPMHLADSFGTFIDDLVNVLAKVKYRHAAGYEYNDVMPTQQKLLELQQSCYKLTDNYSTIYLAYLQMCESACITRFSYIDIPKAVAEDHFVSQVDVAQRNALSKEHITKIIEPYIRQGGLCSRGRSAIDATTINNIFYYKNAKQIFYYNLAKQLIVAEKNLENYGQLPQSLREQLWQAIILAFPANSVPDTSSIFYRFAQFINDAPGEFFHTFANDLPEASALSEVEFYKIMIVAGLSCQKLVIVSRAITDNWQPKRYLSMRWQRQHDLILYSKDTKRVLRQAGAFEQARIWPNELPYCPAHGLSICGNGLIEGYDNYGTFAYDLNIPEDPNARVDNIARDVEKIFREFALIDSKENMLNIFQNTIAFSTVQQTQHTHISKGTLDRYPIYTLPAREEFLLEDARLEVIQVGEQADAIFLRFLFNELEHEALIRFILELNNHLLEHFGGPDHIDAYMHIFRTGADHYAFIYEPHARLLLQQNGKFLNPDNNLTTVRKPQWVIPEGYIIRPISGEFAQGLEYLSKYFDLARKVGVSELIQEFIANYPQTHR